MDRYVECLLHDKVEEAPNLLSYQIDNYTRRVATENLENETESRNFSKTISENRSTHKSIHN